MKLSLSLKLGDIPIVTQHSESELPDLNVYLADDDGNRYVDQDGNNYILQT